MEKLPTSGSTYGATRLEIEQGFPPKPQVTAAYEIAVSGEAHARAVQRRLSGRPPTPPLFPGLPPGPPVAGKTKEDATAAIRACALKKKAPSVWQEASVDTFIGGERFPSIVKPEREIPPDVQGCCCGSTLVPNDDPLPGPVPLP